jgi:hypothetical protein
MYAKNPHITRKVSKRRAVRKKPYVMSNISVVP